VLAVVVLACAAIWTRFRVVVLACATIWTRFRKAGWL
jgi:hypothetical protein